MNTPQSIPASTPSTEAATAAQPLTPRSIPDYINPAIEAKHWREAFPGRSKANPSLGYEHFAVAYRYGWESFRNKGSENTTFESMENELASNWANFKGESKLSWEQAKQATRDAWNRVQAVVHAKTRPAQQKA